VAEAFDQPLEVHGDQRLVLDDQNARGNLLADLTGRFRQQGREGLGADIENARSIEWREPSIAVRRNA
jgi:hypothetical protein